MSADFDKPSKVLVIHGVQTADNNDLRQHESVRTNLTELLSSPELNFDEPLNFSTDIFKYEDINDDATSLVRRVLASMTGNAIAGWVVDKATDLVGDVFLATSQGTVYDEIKTGLATRIAEIHTAKQPLYLVAHSLGSFYALDVVNDLMADHKFSKNDKREWPVHGLVTIGSPLGLELFQRDTDSLQRRKKGVTLRMTPRFPWKNYWDRQDPIVTGSLMGFPKQGQFQERFDRQQAKSKGWSIRSEEINSGTLAHLLAHSGYWTNKTVAQGILNMMYVDQENH